MITCKKCGRDISDCPTFCFHCHWTEGLALSRLLPAPAGVSSTEDKMTEELLS